MRNRKKAEKKDRGDHRHHAIDAVVIALTGPERIQDLARHAEEVEKRRSKLEADGRMPAEGWPKREPLEPPWGNFGEFRRDVLSKVFDEFDNADALGRKSAGKGGGEPIVVSHRPVKRKLIGFFHKEDLWGEVDAEKEIFRIRCNAGDLKPAMLRLPIEEDDKQAKERLFAEIKAAGVPEKEARKRAKLRVEKKEFRRRLVDPSLGKGGLVRDWELRRIIRKCLQSGGLDPDRFTDKQMKEFVKAGRLQMPSGLPIKSVIIIAPISKPVRIKVRVPFTKDQAVNSRTGKPLYRYHISRTNHHIEILEDKETGDWSSTVVRTIDAVERVRLKKLTAVNRTERDGKFFVLSLAEGETVHMLHPATKVPGYFVLFKIDRDPDRLHFIHHWDAGASKDSEDQEAREDVGGGITSGNLKKLGPIEGSPPYKVQVDPLGNVRRLND